MKCGGAATEVDKGPVDKDGARCTGRNIRSRRKLIETDPEYLPIQFSPAVTPASD